MTGDDRDPNLREVTFEDGDSVRRFERTVGFFTSREYWEQLWRNPLFSSRLPRPSGGWVLEADGKIVGHFGSIPMLFAYGDETLVGAAARGVVLDPAYRGRKQGHRLAATFFNQKNVDLLLSTTTNQVAGRLFRKLHARTIPQQGYDNVLFWVLRPSQFLKASFRKKNLPSPLGGTAGMLLAPFLHADILLRKRVPSRRVGYGIVHDLGVDEIGPEFDDLWKRKRSEGKRLLAYRNSEFLSWHFEKQANKERTRLLCHRRDGRLVGYAILVRARARQVGLVRSRIVDLLAEREDPEIIDTLLMAAFDLAGSNGSHVLELIGFPKEIRSRVLLGRPHLRSLSSCPYFYKAVAAHLQTALQDEDRWYACPFDGDASLSGED